jgi:hypothetical protein
MIVSHILHRDVLGRISVDRQCLPRTDVDRMWFRSHIAGKMAVVGAKTFAELPDSVVKSLRLCQVLSHGLKDPTVRNPWPQAFEYCFRMSQNSPRERELMVLGGAKTFEVTNYFVSKVYLTESLGPPAPKTPLDIYWKEPYEDFRVLFEQRIDTQVFKIMVRS